MPTGWRVEVVGGGPEELEGSSRGQLWKEQLLSGLASGATAFFRDLGREERGGRGDRAEGCGWAAPCSALVSKLRQGGGGSVTSPGGRGEKSWGSSSISQSTFWGPLSHSLILPCTQKTLLAVCCMPDTMLGIEHAFTYMILYIPYKNPTGAILSFS